ncbi:MAG: Sapep family Mn(2+)-dependent dipeptidase [Clostridia bacterium]|nr:Sapep family Mn(2+)-dependent dipeptidase [Clostridia bacterium]
MKIDTTSKAIDFWFNDHYAEMLNVLARLVEVRSVAGAKSPNEPNGRGPLIALATMAQIMREYGIEINNFKNSVITADMNKKEPVLGILAHLDVVDAGDGWDSEPFRMKMKDGKLIGRGVMDDKGPAVAALFAMRAAMDIFPRMSKGCRLIFGSAEETGSEDIAAYLKENKLPSNVFTPDADYPVINFEKGRYAPEFSKVFEKADGARVVSFTGGDIMNKVPEKAEAVLAGVSMGKAMECCEGIAGTEFSVSEEDGLTTVTARGRSAHAAHPETGVNAQTALIAALAKMPLYGGGYDAVRALARLIPHGDTEGNALGISMNDEKTGNLTLNFGVLSIGETYVKGGLDLRTPMGASDDNVRAPLEKSFSAEGFRVSGSMVPCHYTPEDSPFIKTLLSVYEDYTGLKGECLAIGGGTYVHDIEGGVAVGCEMPVTDHFIHVANEWISIDELVTSAKIFTRVIIDMCM